MSAAPVVGSPDSISYDSSVSSGASGSSASAEVPPVPPGAPQPPAPHVMARRIAAMLDPQVDPAKRGQLCAPLAQRFRDSVAGTDLADVGTLLTSIAALPINDKARSTAIRHACEALVEGEKNVGTVAVAAMQGLSDPNKAAVAQAAVGVLPAPWQQWINDMGGNADDASRAALCRMALESADHPSAMAGVARANERLLQADPSKRETVRAALNAALQRGGDFRGAAETARVLMTLTDHPAHGVEVARQVVERLRSTAGGPQEAAMVSFLEKLIAGPYQRTAMEEAGGSAKRFGAKVLRLLNKIVGGSDQKANDMQRDRYLEATRNVVYGALAGMGAPHRGVEPLASVASAAIDASSYQCKEDMQVASSVATLGYQALAHEARRRNDGALGAAVQFLTKLESTLPFEHLGEQLTHQRIGLRCLAISRRENSSAYVYQLMKELHPMLEPPQLLDNIARETFGGVPPEKPTERLHRHFTDLLAERFGDLVGSWGQSYEGNCASIAVIKAAMHLYGNTVFDRVDRNGDGGYHIRMQDGAEIDVTDNDFRWAMRECNFHGRRGEALMYGVLCFAAIAKRAALERHHGVRNIQEALDDLNSGQNPYDCAELLGLGKQVFPIGPGDVARYPAAVVYSKNHAIYVHTDNGQTVADHYGRHRLYDGTDTNGRPIRGGVGFTPRAFPGRQYHIG